MEKIFLGLFALGMISCMIVDIHTNHILLGIRRPNQVSFFVFLVFRCTTVAKQGTLEWEGVRGTKVDTGTANSGNRVVMAGSRITSALCFGSIVGPLFILKIQ